MTGMRIFADLAASTGAGGIVLGQLPISPEQFKGLGATACLAFITALALILHSLDSRRAAKTADKQADTIKDLSKNHSVAIQDLVSEQSKTNVLHAETNAALHELSQQVATVNERLNKTIKKISNEPS